MTDKELLTIMATLQVAYPAYYRGISKQDTQAAFNLWKIHFADCDYQAVTMAVNALIDTTVEGFPPTIGAVKAQMYKLENKGKLTVEEAWAAVKKALRNSGYNYNEEFKKLPAECQRAVASPQILHDWSQVDTQELDTVIASNFARIYRARMEESREYAVLAPSVKEYINSLTAGAGEKLLGGAG